MSAIHIVVLIATFVSLAGPGLAQAFAGVGLPAVAHVILAVVGVVGSLKLIGLESAGPFKSSKSSGPKPPLAAVSALMLALCLYGAVGLLSACLPSVATVPVTPDNQAQVSACQTIATTHNDFVVGDFVIGGAAPMLAGVGAGLAPSDPTAGKALGIAATALGAVAVTGAGIAALEASAYASNNCSQVVGPLPILPAVKMKDAGAE